MNNPHNQYLMSTTEQTCIPPTVVSNPTASKGPTAGFAPMPTMTYSQNPSHYYLSLYNNKDNKELAYLQKENKELSERLPIMLRKYIAIKIT